jgi:hypothetical protein
LRVRQEAEMPNTDKSFRQHVQEESTNELVGGNRHFLLFVTVSVIPPEKRDVVAIKGKQSMVGNRNTMSIASEVAHDLFGPAEGWLGIDHPVLTE